MSNWYDAPKLYKEASDCGCPTKYWKAFLMDYGTTPFYNRAVNVVFSFPFAIANAVSLGNFCGGSIYTHDAVIIYFKCLKCGSKFPCIFDLVREGSRHRFGCYEANCLAKYHQTKLWLARDDMKSVFEQFVFGPEKYDPLFYNCAHFANQFYDAICKLDEKSKSYKWSRVLGFCISPLYYSKSDCYIAENTCFCSSEHWKSYQMDLNTAMIFDESKMKGLLGQNTYTTDINVLTLHFKCSECQKEFKTSFYYYEKICRKNGQFRRNLTSNKPITAEIPHDSLKHFLDGNKFYRSRNYAQRLYNSLVAAFANRNVF